MRISTDEILAINEALDDLEPKEPVTARVVKLKYFVGMTLPEIAEALEGRSARWSDMGPLPEHG